MHHSNIMHDTHWMFLDLLEYHKVHCIAAFTLNAKVLHAPGTMWRQKAIRKGKQTRSCDSACNIFQEQPGLAPLTVIVSLIIGEADVCYTVVETCTMCINNGSYTTWYGQTLQC